MYGIKSINYKVREGHQSDWIEIKGGTDGANAHNRLGEAEKSHQKAKDQGFRECWTLLGGMVDAKLAATESPTTDEFFQIALLNDDASEEYQRFREHIVALVGIVDE
ncbi:XcyI family restriction endonuclease [Paenibacillus filicis]|uniref:XcyI family restriction endonuclease n=1 Tax=Paenibacillus filicis TaxID=669464 RepID=A0ABU9DJE0_9BACL